MVMVVVVVGAMVVVGSLYASTSGYSISFTSIKQYVARHDLRLLFRIFLFFTFCCFINSATTARARCLFNLISRIYVNLLLAGNCYRAVACLSIFYSRLLTFFLRFRQSLRVNFADVIRFRVRPVFYKALQIGANTNTHARTHTERERETQRGSVPFNSFK